MRRLLPIIISLISSIPLLGQTVDEKMPEGVVSYITSQNIYVKFRTTTGISIGDTLFVRNGDALVPALLVSNLSSLSVVCTPISDVRFTVNDKINIKEKTRIEPATNLPSETIPVQKVDEKPQIGQQNNTDQKDKTVKGARSASEKKTRTGNATELKGGIDQDKEIPAVQDINGRISVASYSNFSNTPGGNSQRMRYTFSLNAKNISNTRLSAETYVSFVHKDGEWEEIQQSVYNGLKVYNLSVNYEFSRYFRILVGRKINPRLSNIGAIDGLQAEAKIKSVTAGVLIGSRPDYENYSFNAKLFQYGAYLSHDLVTKKGSMQTTLAYAEQKNNGLTDRRFAYFQHSNNLLKGLNFFGTLEFDLYKYDTVSETLKNTFNLTNLYLSLRYRVIKQLSFSGSFSNRHNIIYFETYKNFIDQIIDNEALQGFSLQATYNPIRYLSVGARASYRDRKSDPRPSKNIYGYITYSSIPKVKISATFSATFLETGYITGKIYSFSLSRDLLSGKLSTCLGYRHVSYEFYNIAPSDAQHLAEVNLNWIIYRKLALSLNYEGTFEKTNNYTRLYINLTQRF